MKPEVDQVLRSLTAKLLTEIAPAMTDAYARSNVEVMAGLLAAAAEEFDRAAEVRVEENRAIRKIFRAAAPSIPEAPLRSRLALAGDEVESSLRVSELNAVNDRLRSLLIELHAFVEIRDEAWARQADQAIREALRAAAEQRAMSFFPL